MSDEDDFQYHHGVQMPDGERIAILEANERNMSRRLAAMDTKLDRVVTALDQMTGGKKAVMLMFSVIGGIVGIVATLFGLHLFGNVKV